MKQMIKNILLPDSRIEWVKRIIGLAFLCQVFISTELWHGVERLYPLIPAFGTEGMGWSASMQKVLFYMLIMSSLSLVLIRNITWTVSSFLLILSLLFIEDITRVQAWSYQYFLMLIIVLLDVFHKNRKATILALQWALIFIYFWAGIQKLNIHFELLVYPWLMTAYDFIEPLSKTTWLAYVVASFEILLGIGLFFEKTRKITLILAILFHGFILFLLIGLEWNVIVYPWNIAMVGLLLVLFLDIKFFKHVPQISSKSMLTNLKWKALLPLVFIFFMLDVTPFLNQFGLWSDHLSLKMYTGDSVDARLHLSAKDASCVPEALIDEMRIGEETNEMLVSVDDWAFQELQVPSFGSDNGFKKAALMYCNCAKDKSVTSIDIYHYQRWKKKKTVKRFTCQELYNDYKK